MPAPWQPVHVVLAPAWEATGLRTVCQTALYSGYDAAQVHHDALALATCIVGGVLGHKAARARPTCPQCARWHRRLLDRPAAARPAYLRAWGA